MDPIVARFQSNSCFSGAGALPARTRYVSIADLMTAAPYPVAPLFDWLSDRGTGVFLHPSSLPSLQGIGVADEAATRFLDFLQAAGMNYWQFCPLGPTGYGDSPYQSFSAFAGNPHLIDVLELTTHGLLTPEEVAPLAALPAHTVDYGALFKLKPALLRRAFGRHQRAGAPDIDGESFADFKAARCGWLDAYACFRALKDRNGGRPWWSWPADERSFHGLSAEKRAGLEEEGEAHRFYQYVFFVQWRRLRSAAAARGISLIGDVPIFVAADSADLWSNPSLFEVGEGGLPSQVAGVPPDYFSADGQLWGNPLYKWEAHAADGYAWWLERLKAAFDTCDVLRIDHFRGFEAYWTVSASAKTARKGEWRKGPGSDFFRALANAFPEARIIAEDLGVITPAVVELRDQSGLPGMAVLQFAFGGEADNLYLPHNLRTHSVVYAGTHDNDTTLGWYTAADPKTQDHVRRYLRVDGSQIGWDLIRTACQSVSRLAILSMADILSLGSEARLNLPGRPEGNWQWRMRREQLEGAIRGGTAAYLGELVRLYGRALPARITSQA